jgi:RNA polymerase sigma-70 factor (ECF subfamily)
MSLSLVRQERAFERVCRQHVSDVYQYALAVLRDPEDAEEVTQTTFQNAYRGFCEGRDKRPHLNSLLTIAHEVCRRRGGYQRLVEADFLAAEEPITAADVRRALTRIPFDQRAVIVMREVEGRPCLEIAEILALSAPAVERLLFQARRALREELDGSLSCYEAELAISRLLDARLSPGERRLLRVHLGSCEACGGFAQCLHAQRAALRALAELPLPDPLRSFLGREPEPTASFFSLGRLLR